MYGAYKLFGDVNIGGRIRANHVLKAIKSLDLKGKKILDAGSGDGCYSFYLSKYEPSVNITAVELDESKIKNCLQIADELGINNIDFVNDSLLSIEYEAEFDYVICSDVLEHIPQDELAIKKFHTALKPGGTLVLHVPGLSEKHPVWERYGIIKRKHDNWYEQHTAHRPEFYHDAREGYALEDILHKLRGAGFQILSVRPTYGIFGMTAFQIFKITRMLMPVYVLMLPLLLGLGYLDVTRDNREGFSNLILAVRMKNEE